MMFECIVFKIKIEFSIWTILRYFYNFFTGVEGVVSASDLSPDQNLWGISWIQDEEVFASKTVLHHGQVLAALLCSNAQAGRLAAQKVVVQVRIENTLNTLNLSTYI